MTYNLAKEKVDNFKEYCIRIAKHKMQFDPFLALKDVSVSIKKGEVFGIIGNNGSGKSTMLKVISGILRPTQGTVHTDGTIAPLIELGAGFDQDLTATENIMLNGLVLGYSKKFIEERVPEIVDFSELKDFMDVPLKNFSSGMSARLGFSIATLVKPDILIVDEILSVGDMAFQEKCEMRIKELMDGGTTVILVSHMIDQIERMCDRVMWLDHGIVQEIGNTEKICETYKHKNGC